MSGNPRAPGPGSDEYRVLFELGQGGTAVVSLAMARGADGSQALFVIKQLRSVYASDPDFRAMFTTEARLSARLNHPHVVRVLAVAGEGSEVPRIFMEYIEGQTLDNVLGSAEPTLPRELHLRVLADVLAGLHYSHELLDVDQTPLNVVHRDVSPHNVMVSYDGVVKVLDFGIAKLAGSTVETETGVIKGKLRYMPPEQIAGEEVDRRADVFAVGVMLWEALSGTELWSGLSDAMIMNRVLSGQIPRPDDANGPLPAQLVAICQRALAPARHDRYQTAFELQQALEDYLDNQPQDVTARALGQYMSTRFASLRRAMRERVAGEVALDDPAARRHMGSGRPHSPTPPGSSSASSSGARAEARFKVWIPALGLMALGASIMLWGTRQREEPAPAPAEAPSARRVQVSIEARPASATITVDGEQVTNPYVAERVVDGQLHRLRVSAPGHVAHEIDVAFDTDLRIFRVLSAMPATLADGAPAVAGPHASSPAIRRPQAASPVASLPIALPPAAAATPPAAAPSTSASSPSCDPPYSLDERGIKHFKPECL